MNGSEELLMPSAEYVMAFKWIIDGILLPAVGAVGIIGTRSYAALRAADLDWIVGPGYNLK